jgi:hypothetical protein
MEMADRPVRAALIQWSPLALSLATIVIGIWQFGEQSAQANREPFLKQQMDLAFEASSSAAQLANETDPDEWEKARKTFLRLFWGPLKMVENKKVAEKMGAVKTRMEELVKTHPVAASDLPVTKLDLESRELACELRRLVLSSWRANLAAIEGLDDVCS